MIKTSAYIVCETNFGIYVWVWVWVWGSRVTRRALDDVDGGGLDVRLGGQQEEAWRKEKSQRPRRGG